MQTAFYNGLSGMVAYQEQLNVVGHNIANVNNVGFKPSRSSFTDLMYTQMNTQVKGENLVGHGVKHQGTDLIIRQSGFDNTENRLDFALTEKEGFFAIQNPDGTTEYTRDGTFALSREGNVVFLVASDGSYVLDKGGQKIQVPLMRDRTDLTQEEKTALADSNELDYDRLPELLGVYEFSNPFGLEPAEGNRFRVTPISGEAEAVEQDTRNYVRQGMLEFSGVELANEMVKMIEAQRAFQLNSRVVRTADTMEEAVNSLRQ